MSSLWIDSIPEYEIPAPIPRLIAREYYQALTRLGRTAATDRFESGVDRLIQQVDRYREERMGNHVAPEYTLNKYFTNRFWNLPPMRRRL